jgi:iron complex outermembrane receptor protein
MKRIIFFLLFLLFQATLFSQASLSGTIKNKGTQEGLPGAVIYFPEFKTGVSSDKDGNFKIENLPRVKTLVQIKLLGYKTQVKNLQLNDTSSLIIELEESVIEEEEVVVTGSHHATELKKNPVPMVSIDQKFLQQNTFNNVIESMVKVPGLSALSTGPNVSKPYIRGLGSSRVLTLFDGMRQDGQQWGEEHGIEVDQFLIDRIEVVKGPASLVYGSDALAGVVNLLPANPLPDGSSGGEFMSAYQTNNKQYAGSLNFAGSKNGIIYSIRASKKAAGNYENKFDGKVYGTKYSESDLNLSTGINRSWGYSHLNFSYYDNIQEIPDGSRDSVSRKFTKQISEEDTLRPIVKEDELNSYVITSNHQRIRHTRIFSTNSFYLGNSRLVMKYGFQQSLRQEFAHPQFPTIPALNLQLNTGTYDIKFHLPEKNGWDGDFGINGMLQENKNLECTEFVIPNYKSFDLGPFAFLKKEFKKLTLSAGARYDLRRFTNAELYTVEDTITGFLRPANYGIFDPTLQKTFEVYSHTFTGFSGSFGMNYDLSKIAGVKANVARGYRAPNISEISAKGIHPGTGFLQIGEKDLLPEFSLQEDLGLYFETEHFSGEVDIFNNVISNYIYNTKLSSKLGGDSLSTERGIAYPVFKFTQTVAQLQGAEFSFDLHPHPLDWLHFENSISVLFAQNLSNKGVPVTDSTKYLPTIPPLHTNSELRADFKKKIGCFKEIFVKAGFQYFAAQDRVYSAYGTETRTPGYFLLDAGIGTSLVTKSGRKLFTVMIAGNNLTDEAYQSNMSRLKYFDNYPKNGSGRSGIYNMGRNFSFKLIIPLEVAGSN